MSIGSALFTAAGNVSHLEELNLKKLSQALKKKSTDQSEISLWNRPLTYEDNVNYGDICVCV